MMFGAVNQEMRRCGCEYIMSLWVDEFLRPLTFMPISMCERSANGTSLVTSSHSNTAKLHMSADLLLMSSGLFCRAANKTDKSNHKPN